MWHEGLVAAWLLSESPWWDNALFLPNVTGSVQLVFQGFLGNGDPPSMSLCKDTTALETGV